MTNKRNLTLSLVAVLTLVFAVVGAAYAYFTVGTGSASNTTVNATVQSVGMVTLSGGDSLTLNVTAENMAKANGGTTYSAVNTDGERVAKVATATLVGGESGINYNCTFDLTVENTSSMTGLKSTDGGVNVTVDSIATLDNTTGLVSGEHQSPEKVVSGTYKVNFSMTSTGSDQEVDLITVGADVLNDEEDGTQAERLAGKNINLTFSVSNFTCDTKEVEEEKTMLADYLLENPSAGLSTTAYSGMYRYTGTDGNVNNYIKLDNVLYRIIGIVSEDNATLGLEKGMIKVIKAETIGNQKWWTTYNQSDSDVKWEQSLIYQRLNDLDTDETNNVLSNTSIIPSAWVNRIASVKWNVGDVNTDTNSDAEDNATNVVSYEDNTQTSSTSKIGLMYLSDLYYSYNAGGTQNCYSRPYCNSWMVDTSTVTWTMSRYGQASDGGYYAWPVYPSGHASGDYLTSESALRPVFYLESNVQYAGEGSGASGDPIQIA